MYDEYVIVVGFESAYPGHTKVCVGTPGRKKTCKGDFPFLFKYKMKLVDFVL